MQISRLLEMVYILLDQRTVTAKALADRFEVSVRTVLRDVEALAEAGVPVYTTQGKGGGISILDSYVLDKVAVSKDEQEQILFALQSSTGLLSSDGVLAKLRALFDKAAPQWIEVDFSRWGRREPDTERFTLLRQAILEQRAISFQYPNAAGDVLTRMVYPLKLVFKGMSWYLQGFCLMRHAYRTFKINRILSLARTDAQFDGSQMHPPPIESMDGPSPALANVAMRFPPHAAYRVYDEFDPVDITQADDGSLHVSVCLADDEWIYGYVLSFGTDVELLAPAHIRDGLRRHVNALQKLYQPT